MTMEDHLDVIIHILGFLPSSHKAAVAKLVCKAAHSAFEEYTSISIAGCADLPSECVLDILKQSQQVQFARRRRHQHQLMAAVAKQGNLPRLQLLRHHGCDYCSRSICAAAAEGGHHDILQWLRAQDPPCPWNGSVNDLAAAGGYLNILQWVKAQDPPFKLTYRACEAAASGGHLAVVQWLVTQDLHAAEFPMCIAAAHHGHLHVIQWLYAYKSTCSDLQDHIYAAAAIGGHLAVLQWLKGADQARTIEKRLARLKELVECGYLSEEERESLEVKVADGDVLQPLEGAISALQRGVISQAIFDALMPLILGRNLSETNE